MVQKQNTGNFYHKRMKDGVPGPSTKRSPEKEGKINTGQEEPVATNSWAVGQFLSISCEAFI